MFTTYVIRPLKCCNIFTPNVKTIINSRDAKCENFFEGFMACQSHVLDFVV